MLDKAVIRVGMDVFGADAKLVGSIEATGVETFQVGGKQILRGAITRVAHGRVFLKQWSLDYLPQA